MKQTEPNYHTEFYNETRGDEQRLRLGEGCPNRCEFCYSKPELISYDIPEITKNKVSIMDMNFLYDSKHKERIKDLGSRKVENKVVYYELICGIDWRLLDQETAVLLKQNRFINIRFAWDHTLKHQMKIKDCVNMLLKAGYKPKELSCFIICNWKILYEDCLRKLDLLKIWNIKVNDCWFDNQLSPNIEPIYWTKEQIKDFRNKCRKHNQMVLFGIDPELK